MRSPGPFKRTFDLLCLPLRVVWRGWECVESVLFTSVFYVLFQAGRFLLGTVRSPWGLILPLTGIVVVLLGVFLARQPRELGLALIDSTRTVEEKDLAGIMERVGKLGDAALPAYVHGLNSPRESVFFACRDAIEERLTRAKFEPAGSAGTFYLELIRELETTAPESPENARVIAAAWARSILRDLLVRDDAAFPNRGWIVAQCEQTVARAPDRRRFHGLPMEEEAVPPQRFANGEPRGRVAPIDTWRFDPLIADEPTGDDSALFDRFAAERAGELNRYEQEHSGPGDYGDPLRRPVRAPEREGSDAVLLARDSDRPFPEPLTMQYLAAHAGRFNGTPAGTPALGAADRAGEPSAAVDTGAGKVASRRDERGREWDAETPPRQFPPTDTVSDSAYEPVDESMTGTTYPAFGEGRFAERRDGATGLPDVSKNYRETHAVPQSTPSDAFLPSRGAQNTDAAASGNAMPAPRTAQPVEISSDSHALRTAMSRPPTIDEVDEPERVESEHVRPLGKKSRSGRIVSRLLPVEETGLNSLYPEDYALLPSTDLMRILHHPDPNRVEIAVAVLQERDGFTEGHLRIAGRLFHPDVAVRMELPRILRNVRANDPSEWVDVLLADPNPEVRCATIAAFASSRDEKVLKRIATQGRRDTDPRVENLVREVEQFRQGQRR